MDVILLKAIKGTRVYSADTTTRFVNRKTLRQLGHNCVFRENRITVNGNTVIEYILN